MPNKINGNEDKSYSSSEIRDSLRDAVNTANEDEKFSKLYALEKELNKKVDNSFGNGIDLGLSKLDKVGYYVPLNDKEIIVKDLNGFIVNGQTFNSLVDAFNSVSNKKISIKEDGKFVVDNKDFDTLALAIAELKSN